MAGELVSLGFLRVREWSGRDEALMATPYRRYQDGVRAQLTVHSSCVGGQLVDTGSATREKELEPQFDGELRIAIGGGILRHVCFVLIAMPV